MAKEIAEVRRTREVNTMDRQGVAEILFEIGFDYSVECVIQCRRLL